MLRIKRSKFLILCFTLVLSFISLVSKSQAADFSKYVPGEGIKDSKPEVNGPKSGNTSGNFANGSFVAFSKGFVYYNKSSDGYKIYRERPSGTGEVQVSDTHGASINVVGDWVYYSSLFEDPGIYKVKTDGSQKTKLSSDASMFIYVVNGWIYYSDSSEDLIKIFRIKTDGTSKEEIKLCDDNSLYYADINFNVQGDWIYTNVANPAKGQMEFYRVKVDGTEKNLILENQAIHFSIVDNWVYYISDQGYTDICRIRPNGTEKTVIYSANASESYFYSLNVSDGNIYFSSLDYNYFEAPKYLGLYKMKLDGTNVTKLTNTWCTNLCIAGDWIYLDGNYISKIKIDGTGETVVY